MKLIRTTLEVTPGTIMVPFSATTKQGREEIYEILDGLIEEAEGENDSSDNM